MKLKKNNKKIVPLISIITVVKNEKNNLLKTIKSIKKLKFNNFEHIIIDGKSTDGTIDILKKQKDKNIKWISKKDKNLWDAMNRGIKLSKGQIIGILNSGDIFYPNALRIVKKYFEKKKIDFFFGSVKKVKIYSGFEPEKINYRFNIWPSHSASFFITRRAQKKVGYYDTYRSEERRGERV